jgi:hypothetical protein
MASSWISSRTSISNNNLSWDYNIFRLKIYSQLLAKANAKALNKQFPSARTDFTKNCIQAYRGKWKIPTHTN